jgi:hypothetical protein
MTDDQKIPTPPQTAAGRSDRWELFGEVCVDGASLSIVDPGYVSDGIEREEVPKGKHAARCLGGLGVWFWSGFGDGGYEVWGRIADYGTPQLPDERVAEVRIIMITEEALREWREFH